MQHKETPWITISNLLFFLATTCSCFLHSSLPSPAGDALRQTTATLLFDGSKTYSFVDVASQGITSLLNEENSGIIVAGTKSGEVLQSMDNAMTWTQLSGYNHKPKYPVYSLAVETKTSSNNNSNNNTNNNNKIGRIFCGRGDRYISVWDTETEEYVQRLGPHTGWVQDLAYDDDSQFLYSIGCNCIEVWDCSGRDTSDGSVKHVSKLSVENSVSASTLSSDLLRLCLVGRQHLSGVKERGKGSFGQQHLLLAAGVDGRIHSWSIYRSASLVHEGRINALTYSSLKSQILFSVGNDGKLCASRIASDSQEIELVSELELEGSPRLTTVTILEETDNDELELVVGTTEGDIIFVSAKVQASDKSITLTEGETTNIHKGAKVYAALPLPIGSSLEPSILKRGSSLNDTRVMLVGHAKGLVRQSFNLPF